MGKPVTVDSDDLQHILMSTGIVKDMEKLIRKQKDDPFISKDEAKLRDAHDALAAEWRRAVREVHPQADEPLSEKAAKLLWGLSGKISHIDQAAMRLPLYKELFVKLMIEYGNGYEIIYWGATQQQQRLNETPKIVVRVTPRGLDVLDNMTALEQIKASGVQ